MIDKKSRVPLYAQLIDIIVAKINSGELKEHDKLPSERELCEMYNISRTTIRQAMIELENEGYIYKEHGKGSFVAPQTYTQSLVKFYSFSEEMKRIGKTPSSKILSFLIQQASPRVARHLNIEEGQDVYKIIRLRLADDEPIMYETTYLPKKFFNGLKKSDLENDTMYNLFRSKYNFSISNGSEKFKAVLISENEAPFLQQSIGAPAMRIERTAYSRNLTIEYTVTIARGDKYVYTVDLN